MSDTNLTKAEAAATTVWAEVWAFLWRNKSHAVTFIVGVILGALLF